MTLGDTSASRNFHPIVKHILSCGYNETHGEDKVLADFERYCDYLDVSAAKLKPTNQQMSDFLDFITGYMQPSDDDDNSVSSVGQHDIVEVLSSSEEGAASMDQDFSEQDSDSADEIECSSEEGAVSPASVQANKTSSARTSEQQHHARVHSKQPPDVPNRTTRQCTLTAFMQPAASGHVQADMAQSASVPKSHTSSSRPATAREAAMDLIDLANLKIFGNRHFRPQQKEIIKAALQNQDCFVLMPTGGGKSLCYQLPAVVARGVTLVISPLLSLMQDQVTGLTNTDVPASFINSQQTRAEVSAVFRELNKPLPTCKLLYITPEQFVKSTSLQSLLTSLHRRGLLARLVVDEAHCISSWGHDFRPEYKQLGQVKVRDKHGSVTGKGVSRCASHGSHSNSHQQSHQRHPGIPQDTALQAVPGQLLSQQSVPEGGAKSKRSG